MSTRFDHIPKVMELATKEARLFDQCGRVNRVVGTIVQASVPGVKVGEICILSNPDSNDTGRAEVIGFSGEEALLSPIGTMIGISSHTLVTPTGHVLMVPVGDGLLGRVLDGLGRAIDTDVRGPIRPSDYYPVLAEPPNPLERTIITKPISLGIRAIDGMITCGEGQRIGIFAAAGGGKSTLLASIIRNTEADVSVLALIGERGREVREFIEKDLGEEGLRRAVVVCATSDRSATERLKAAYVATAIAEYYRDHGKKVLLLMDSVTRFGRALREIGLSAGEPPTRRGFPPSVFAELPKLMERAGNSSRGSITALYTVLVEGDDMTEPIADETRSILDGHIILSRKLAALNHYPAIDILASLSRCQSAIVPPEHRKAAARVREFMAKYQEVELLIKLGEYKKGSDSATDEAVEHMPRINDFLKQGLDERPDYDETIDQLEEIAS